MQHIPTAKEVRDALQEYVTPSTPLGVFLFLSDMLQYLTAIALVLFAPGIPAKVLAGIFAGVKMGNLATLAHDAAHNTLTASRTLNKWLGILAFTPGLFNYRLWIYDHHVLHHAHTNEDHPDSFTPLSKAEYDALSRWGRFKQRVYRARSLLFFGAYYIVERWWKAKFFPRQHMPDTVRSKAVPHSVYLIVYLAGFLALLVAAPLYSETSSVMAVLCGFLLPFYVYQSLFALGVYVQHNHYRVAWFKDKPDRSADGRQDVISVHMRLPLWTSRFMHHVFEHTAHHVLPAIPCYRLRDAQTRLNEMLGDAAVVEDFSVAKLREIQHRCKLYDYDSHRWTDFNGKPTSRVTLLSKQDPTRLAAGRNPASASAYPNPELAAATSRT